MDTREVIDRYYETVNAGDWDTWLTLFADDVVVDEQLAGHLEGVGVLRGAVGAMKKGYSKFLMLPEHVVIEAEQAAVIWHCEAANATGVPIDVRGANYFRVEEGKIVYMANFHDKGAFAPFTSQKLD
ncbi:MAG TPA: nuclear transport factor 2 family protein [Actinomycetota bacterium]|nr:nuclear transport factor 2 family protein [Actinomycetota bacterium]